MIYFDQNHFFYQLNVFKYISYNITYEFFYYHFNMNNRAQVM